MWSLLGGLLGGALLGGSSIFGSLIGANSSDNAARKAYDAQKETNELNYQMFKENQQWMEHMSNTAHQREVQDLREAGLNPILSATGGSGASTPSLATPTAVSPGSPIADKSTLYQGMISGVIDSINTASKIGSTIAGVQKAFSETKKNDIEAVKILKEIKFEVGKRHLPAFVYNALSGAFRDSREGQKMAFDALKALMSSTASQVKILKQNYFNSTRDLPPANRPVSISSPDDSVQLERMLNTAPNRPY